RKRTAVSPDWANGDASPVFAWSSGGDALIVLGGRSQREKSIHHVSLSGRDRVLVSNARDLELCDVAPDDRILVDRLVQQVSLFCKSPGENRERDLAWFEGSAVRDLSRDGKFVLFSEIFRTPQTFLRKTDGSPAIRLGDGSAVCLSPDNQWAL